MSLLIDKLTSKELIFSGTHSIIYRVYDEKKSKNVIIKVLKYDYPTVDQLARFTYEYEIAKNLMLEGTIEVNSLEKYKNTLAIIMEDFGGIDLAGLIDQKPLAFETFFSLAIPIVEILGEIHKKSVIHKDINPMNIVYNPATKVIKIIDFGISSTLPKETPEICSPNVLEGTLAYISPEQTGRMNRTIDYRTDYYSLGVTFYQMLTGILPFETDDPMALVHSHIAKTPRSPREVNPTLPVPLSDIVMKLMEKNAEKRYQSSYGLKYDLQFCLDQLMIDKSIEPFKLGSKDISFSFHIPEKLYGREKEIDILLQAFDRASCGKAEFMLVAGYSGIGKSALIHEVHKPIVEKRGYFISGKYDQYRRDIAYSAIIQAFNEWIHQILTEGEESIAKWKQTIESSLKETVNVISSVIPKLEYIVGPQPELILLGPSETQNRFISIFQIFIQAIANSEHPLTLFLDDLQWADVSSLNLLKALFMGPSLENFLLIGAYRDNEVSPTHILMLALNEMDKGGFSYETLSLEPLKIEHVNQILFDTLLREEGAISSLANLCYEKTKGNPFFLNQLLLSLYKEQLIFFDIQNGYWSWAIEEIQAKEISPNVVDLMTQKIQKLSTETQNILTLASCIGNTFNIKILSSVNNKSPNETSQELLEALQEGLIIPDDNAYKYGVLEGKSPTQYHFLHDRVQQASYNLISPEKRVELNYRIGHIYLDGASDQEIEENIFEIVSHLNQSSELIQSEEERVQLARLNLLAAKKTKASAAFKSATDYLQIAKDFLPENSWDTLFDLTFEIKKEYAIGLFITAQHDAADPILQEILDHSRTPLEQAEVALTQCALYSNAMDQDKSIEAGLKGLKILKLNIPKHPSPLSILKEVLLAKWNLGRRKIPDLINEPVITDKTILLQLELMKEIAPPAYLAANFDLFLYICLNQVNIILKNGNAPIGAAAFVAYALVLNAVLGDMKSANEFGKLAIEVTERYPDLSIKCRTYTIYAVMIHHWNQHRKTVCDLVNKAIEYGIESGAVLFKCHSCTHANVWDPSANLELMVKEVRKNLSIIQQAKYQDCWDLSKVHLQLFENLLGKTKDNFSLSDDFFDEFACLERMEKNKLIAGTSAYYFCKSLIYFLYYDYPGSLSSLYEVDKRAEGFLGLPYMPDHRFYGFLICAANYPLMNAKDKRKIWRRLKKDYKQMKKWADHSPINFSHNQLLMEAEMARLSGDPNKAIHLYEKAILAAKNNDYLQTEAVANELTGKFYLEQQLPKVAKVYLLDAHYCYGKWGAVAKQKHLEATYPDFFAEESSSGYSRVTITSRQTSQGTSQEVPSETLDMATVMKASQVISGEIILRNLIDKMMHIVIENAGAEKGVLILRKGDDYFIEAEASINLKEVKSLQHLPLEDLPLSIINYVISTKEPVVLRDAMREGIYKNDPYIKSSQLKSILCFPLLHQGKMKGLLYFENNLIQGAFTQRRVNLLNLISSQIAVSIENAQFYAELEEKVEERTNELKQAQNQLVFQEKMASLGSLTAGIAHELKNPLNFVINFAEIAKQDLDDLINSFNTLSLNEQQEGLKELKEHLETIDAQGVRADGIIKKMLAHSHEGSKILEKTDVNNLLDQAIQLAHRSFLKKDPSLELTLKTTFAENLPEIDAYQSDLMYAFINFVDNACYALSEKAKQTQNGFVPTLDISTSFDKKNIKIVIRDNGPGIPKNVTDKIFTPFFTTKPTGMGTGLGLSLAYDTITKLHDGTIAFVSTPGVMTEFEITLPYKR